MNLVGIAIGLLSGLLVGASSIGSGSLVTPLLLMLTPVPAGAAVGTSLALASGTKLFGYAAHHRMGHIDHRLGGWLVAGAVPGAALGALILGFLRHASIPAALPRHTLGIMLIALALLLMIAPRCAYRSRLTQAGPCPEASRFGPGAALLIGGGVSFAVTLTSVGSGGLLMLALLFWRPSVSRGKSLNSPLCSLVGTAIFAGLVTTLLGATVHFALDNIDFGLLGQLVLGSVPGVLLGARIAPRIPERYYETGIAGLNLLLGLRLAFAG